jgi:uncharacterized protein (DUF1800 family)
MHRTAALSVLLVGALATGQSTPAASSARSQQTGTDRSGELRRSAGALAKAERPGPTLPTDRESVEHAVNRLTFGPRPGEVDEVRTLGLAAWIDQQLTPARIDDSALTRRLPAPPERPDSIASPREARQFGRQSVVALSEAKILRAVYGERQLEEVLVDFWFNHFNVFAGKGRTSLFLPEYERDAIRPHVLGRFRDLLGATAKSPAMLFYLDNWLSADPEAAARVADMQKQRRSGRQPVRPNQPNAQQRKRGLNENYGRELLELHTLGVDGGYSQQDVVEVARAFTGWTIGRQDGGAARARATAGAGGQQMAMDDVNGEFRFTPALHDTGAKVVLGQKIKAGGGIDDGERVLDIVASHPATARHIATKLVRRFVSDDPPESLVARVAARFQQTDGDLREVVRAVITSPEFFAPDMRRAKMKTPLEFVASALRATGREISDPRPVLRALQQLGMQPYMCQPPTGYDDTAETWITAGALVTRMNVAQQLAGAQAAVIGGPEFQRR